MERDYISIEELNKIKNNTNKTKFSNDGNFLDVLEKIGHGITIIFKLIWKTIGFIFNGIYTILLKINEGLDKASESKMGKRMIKKYEAEQKNTPLKRQNNKW